MPRFPSLEWAEEFCRRINMSEEYRRAARGWVWPILFVVEDVPEEYRGEVGDRVGLYVDLRDGECLGVKLVQDISSSDAPFVISGSYGDWMDVIKGGADPIKALVTRKIRLVKGSFSTVLRYPKAAIALVKLAQEVGFD